MFSEEIIGSSSSSSRKEVARITILTITIWQELEKNYFEWC